VGWYRQREPLRSLTDEHLFATPVSMISFDHSVPSPPLPIPPVASADARASHQRSFDELGTPLFDVTFCVVDLETTGTSAQLCGITEIGAVKIKGGEFIGTFQTMINPGSVIPPEITVLTGITNAMVLPAPRIESVLPTLLEFIGDAVIVGHNVRFDLSFLQAALDRAQQPKLTNQSVDTCGLARRLVRDEVANCKLGTLASHFGLAHQPSHRALDDALATADLLHVLLERCGGLGVSGLDDLITLPKMAGHAQADKLRLTTSLPRRPGVYVFRNRAGAVLYVGKATNLRARVRSYFSSDTRRKIGQLLAETHSIDHRVCATTLEAAVIEVRLIHEHLPRYNQQSKNWKRYPYLKLTLNDLYPRLSVVRLAPDDGSLYLGPLPSTRIAKQIAEAIEMVVPLRKCSAIPGHASRSGVCAPAQLGIAVCPCAGEVEAHDYAVTVQRTVRGLLTDPDLLLSPLIARMGALAAEQRFEEAADVRERAAALTMAISRQRRFAGLIDSGRIVVEVDGAGSVELSNGQLSRSWDPNADSADPTLLSAPPLPFAPAMWGNIPKPLGQDLADELNCVASWLEVHAGMFRLVSTDRGLASLLPRLPSLDPRHSGLVRSERRDGRDDPRHGRDHRDRRKRHAAA